MIDVVCAVMVGEGKVLACQRPYDKEEGGKWEFPGGKVEPGEEFHAALRREIEEELDLVIMVEDALGIVEHNGIRLHPFISLIIGGQFRLKEHLASNWLNADTGDFLPWAPADRAIWVEVRQRLNL